MAGLVSAADWRDAEAYAPLLGAERACFAWEWLRRDPAYRGICRAAGDAAAFGLARIEDCEQPALSARPIWLASHYDRVVRCSIGVGTPIALDRLGLDLVSAAGNGCAHLLLSDGLHSLRIDAYGWSGASASMRLRIWLEGVADTEGQLAGIAQLRQLLMRGRLPNGMERRAGRWVAALRVHDALAEGASYREIAHTLFGEHSVGPRWWLDTPSWGLRISRLAAASRAALAAGPRPWLCSG